MTPTTLSNHHGLLLVLRKGHASQLSAYSRAGKISGGRGVSRLRRTDSLTDAVSGHREGLELLYCFQR